MLGTPFFRRWYVENLNFFSRQFTKPKEGSRDDVCIGALVL